MSADLKPCPFCAGEASFEEVAGAVPNTAAWSVGCGDIECMGFQSLAQFARKWEAAEAWNRRAPTDAEERGRLKGLEEAAKVADRVAAVEGNPGMPLDDAIHSTWKAASNHIANEIRIRALAGKTEEKVG